MTGYGRAVAGTGGRRITVELRAVNHRFLDLKVRLPWPDAALEDRVGQLIRRRADRGAFTVVAREEQPGGAAVRVDAAAARALAGALEELRRELALPDPVTLALLAGQPGVLVAAAAGDPDEIWAALGPAVEQALEELLGMRRLEGASLAADLRARLERLAALADEISGLAAAAPEEWRRRLAERVEKLLASAATSVAVDPARLATEVAVLADRVDVTEELVRLRSHLGQCRALLDGDAPVGRRLDFLVQELGREVNTIGSKSQSADVSARVVEAKAELEKIREQVQNVE